MPTKKMTSRISSSRPRPITRANQLTVVMVCALFVLVGVFLVYKSFAATLGIK